MVQICYQVSHPCFIFLISIATLKMYNTIEQQKWTYEDYPNPLLHPYNCSRSSPSYVCDPDNILSHEEADQLDFTIMRIRNDTTCICPECKIQDPGITIAIALMKNIKNSFSISNDERAKDFAIYLRHNWNFGRCDDDVIVLVSSADHQSYVATGAKVSSVLPLELTDKIFDSSKDHFNNGYFYQGLESIVESYYDVLRQLQQHSPKDEGRSRINKRDITIALVISVATLTALLIFLAILLYRMKKRERKTTLRTNLTRWHNPKQIKADNYKNCNTDEYNDDGNSEGEPLEDSDDIYDSNQLSKIYISAKRQLSAVLEESENEDDDDEVKSEERSRTLSFNQKSNINNIPRIPRFQHRDNQISADN